MIVHIGITLDCVNPEQLGRFWSDALDLVPEAEGDYVLLRNRVERSGIGGFTLQRVPEPKVVKNRMHVDVVVSEVDNEVDRLEQLGAVVLAREAEPSPYATVVMSDPEGNEFCVIQQRRHE